MLTAKFAFKFKPIVKQVLACLYYLKMLQGDVLITLCLVVAVYLLQMFVEQVAKELKILRTLLKLDEPLMAALGILVHKHWSCSIL